MQYMFILNTLEIMKRDKMKGYNEWITQDKVGFITNCFGHILYINSHWPNGNWDTWDTFGGLDSSLSKEVRDRCKKGRTFNKEELVLELL